jgi:hypothetical protein
MSREIIKDIFYGHRNGRSAFAAEMVTVVNGGG